MRERRAAPSAGGGADLRRQERRRLNRAPAAVAAGLLLAAAPAANSQPSRTESPTVSEMSVTGPKTVSELVVVATKTVSELVVTAPVKCLRVERSSSIARAPKVVSTFPADGQVVPPGLLVIRVTFDRPVACSGGLADDPPLPNPCPASIQPMVLSYDRRTVRTVCLVDPNRRYGAWLSRSWDNTFMSLQGVQAEPFRFGFATSGDPAVTNVCGALVQDAETVRQIEQRQKLDCAAYRGEGEGLVRAEMLRRAQEADLERERTEKRAAAEAEARARVEARELAQAEAIAQDAYAKALARERKGSRQRDDALVSGSADSGAELTPPSRAGGSLDPRALTASPVRPPSPTRTPEPPRLTDWRRRVSVSGHAFDCAVAAGAVACHRSPR